MANVRKKVRVKKKTERVPFSAKRSKLQVSDAIDGHELRWFNDIDGRLQRALDGGWQFVEKTEVPSIVVGQGEIHQENTDLNSRVSKVVSRGEPVIRAYLMKISSKFYREDQKAKEMVNQRVDEAMRAGQPGGNVVENQYVPQGHTQKI